MAVGGGDTQLAGRERELADLGAAIKDLHGGDGGFRGYQGDPGIGKTALLLAAAKMARDVGLATTWLEPQRLASPRMPARGGEPAVVLIDDLHRLGDTEVQQLDQLLELTARPVLVVAAWRPRQASLSLTAKLCQAAVRHGVSRLAPLTLDETRQLVGDRPDLESLHRASEGFPLYAKILADASHLAHLSVELAALPAGELAVAQAAAVLGGPFVPETLLAVSDVETELTRAALDSLVRLDLIRTSETGPLLAFRHDTVAKAAYHSTTVSRRGSLHLRADRELERRGAPAIARAGHVANSFDPARPDRYLTLALGAAQALSTDPATAEGWLEAAEARLAGNHPHWRQTQLLLGRARLNLGRFDDSRATFLQLTHGSTPEQTAAVLHTGRIERLLGRYQEAEALLRAGLSRATSAAARATGLYELSAVAAECSEFTDSDRLATEAARLAEAAGDQLLRCTALAASAWARTSLGDIAGAQASVSAAATVVDAMADAQAAQDIDCLRLIGQTELVLDRLTDAARHLDRGVRLARHNGQRHVLPNLLKSQAELEFRLGRLDRAGLVLDEAEPLSAETGVVIIQTLVATIRAGTLLWHRPSAQSAESLAAAESAMAHSAGAGNGLTWRLHAQGALGETLVFTGQAGHGSQIMLTAGGGPLLPRLAAHRRVRWWEILAFAAVAGSDLARAEEFAALAVEAAQSAPTDIRLGFAYRARALVENAKGATAAALVAGQLAAARFTAAGAQLDLGRTHLLLAGAELSAGRVEAASDHLAMAGALARRCQAARLSEQVEAELARLPSRPRGIDWQARLTTRERDIAELAGQALASTTIAARLHLSVRTVDSYLGKIYRKLGVTNRVALANLLRAAQPETES